MGNIIQPQGLNQSQNQSQGQAQNGQSPQNQYQQQSSQMSNEVNFKKNRASTQITSIQLSNASNQMPQQNISGTGSGYMSGSNQVIQQAPMQSNASNSNQNIPPNQGSKIS
jgi:hypothetical protein